MRPLTEQDIRASFVNCSKGDAKRLAIPRDLGERPWDDLDFLGWRDPGAPDRSYLVLERGEDLVGVALRFPTVRRGSQHRSMCSVCLTTHRGGGVCLMTARKAGPRAVRATPSACTCAPTWRVPCTSGGRRCRSRGAGSRRA